MSLLLMLQVSVDERLELGLNDGWTSVHAENT